MEDDRTHDIRSELASGLRCGIHFLIEDKLNQPIPWLSVSGI